ncbi:MAG: hypothetical protein WCD37_08670 [Chloroflexia bacterium]
MIDEPVLRQRLQQLRQNINAWIKDPKNWGKMWELKYLDIAQELWDTLEVIGNRAQDLKKRLEAVSKNLDAVSNAPEPEARAAWTKAWQDYDMLYKESQALFDESLAFVRGLVVRDRLSAMSSETILSNVSTKIAFAAADSLCRKASVVIGGVGSAVMTLPAGNAPGGDGSWRAAYLRFPGWQIWTVPMAIYEFALLTVQEYQPFADFIDKLDSEDPPLALNTQHLQIYLADALTTYLLGPAYPCAAVHLRLEVVNANLEDADYPAPAKRASLILGILERMNQKEAQELHSEPYRVTIDTLRSRWRDMIAFAGGTPDLSPKDQAAIDSLVNACWDKLYEYVREVSYRSLGEKIPAEGWVLAQQWSDLWIDDENNGSASLRLPQLGPEALRMPEDNLTLPSVGDVLNTAWYLRLTTRIDLSKIEAATRGLCEIILATQRKVDSQGKSVPTPSSNMAQVPQKELDKNDRP